MCDFRPARLTRHERDWLDQQATELNRPSDDRPPRSLTGRIQRACDTWALEAGWVARGLVGATVAFPPSPEGGRRGSGPADPTGAALIRTLDQLDRDIVRFAHLAGPCPADGGHDHRGMLHRCPDPTATTLVDALDLDRDPTQIIDGLLGTPTTSPRTFDLAANAAYAWHAQTASMVLDRWRTLYRQGAEPSVLGGWAEQAEQVARHMTHLAAQLAYWSDRTERRCKTCDAAAPDGRATCGRCRTATWRRKTAG